MSDKKLNLYTVLFLIVGFISVITGLLACQGRYVTSNSYDGSAKTANYPVTDLPRPYHTPSSQNFSDVVGWKEGETPKAPQGFRVNKFAGELEHPRWLYVASNGDVFVAESNTILKGVKKAGSKISRKIKTQHIGESANQIWLLRDEDHDGIAEKRYLFGAHFKQPFGMLIIGEKFYVANTDALLVFSYKTGDTSLSGKGDVLTTYPGEGRHWARNIITNAANSKIYIGVGSSTNVAENGIDKEKDRADILVIDVSGQNRKVYAAGLRNPCGMDWAPGTDSLWTAVNERDELGDELVPDYLTAVHPGGFYGWPYSYYGQNQDPRMMKHMNLSLVNQAIVPDLPVGSHTASLGLLFYRGERFPEAFRGGAFVTQHGSWNRSVISGYKVIFIPFKDGRPAGAPQDFLTGFVDNLAESKVHGRPVGIAESADGSLLVSDDSTNTIWRVSQSQ